jgi:hypothetical protein
MEAASGRTVSCTMLSRDERAARILVGGNRGVGRVRDWIASGVPWGEAIARMQGSGS